MKIFIYVTGQPKALVADLINRLDKVGVPFYVDINLPTSQWYESNLVGNCRVFDNAYQCYSEILPDFQPFLLCAAEVNEEPDWGVVTNTLKGDIGGMEPTKKQKSNESFDEGVIVAKDETEAPKVSENYELETYYEEDHDTMFYEMIRPGQSRAWTSVTNNYSTRGHLPFFSSYFYLNDFGKDGKDLDFLKYFWGTWEMVGTFNPEECLKAHIAITKKDETLGPRVYQNKIKYLIDLFNKNTWPYYFASSTPKRPV